MNSEALSLLVKGYRLSKAIETIVATIRIEYINDAL